MGVGVGVDDVVVAVVEVVPEDVFPEEVPCEEAVAAAGELTWVVVAVVVVAVTTFVAGTIVVVLAATENVVLASIGCDVVVVVARVSDEEAEVVWASSVAAPSAINVLILASVFGPTAPIDSIPFCSCSFLTAASVLGP